MIGIMQYRDLFELIMNEMCDTDINFKIKGTKEWRRGKIVTYAPLSVDECIVGIEVDDHRTPKCSTIEYYTFSEINVTRYEYKED